MWTNIYEYVYIYERMCTHMYMIFCTSSICKTVYICVYVKLHKCFTLLVN